MVQGTQGFRQVRAVKCIVPTSCVVVCIALGVVEIFPLLKGSLPALIYSGGTGLHGKVLTGYYWSPTPTRSGSFPCTTTKGDIY